MSSVDDFTTWYRLLYGHLCLAGCLLASQAREASVFQKIAQNPVKKKMHGVSFFSLNSYQILIISTKLNSLILYRE